jgi:hypothetical protein
MRRITEDARERLDKMTIANGNDRDLKNILTRLEAMVTYFKKEIER